MVVLELRRVERARVEVVLLRAAVRMAEVSMLAVWWGWLPCGVCRLSFVAGTQVCRSGRFISPGGY